MGGNDGGNSGISEFLSIVLEPVAREQDNNMEINATNGLLADIFELNKELENETVDVSTPGEDWSIPQEEFSSLEKEPVSHEDDPECNVPGGGAILPEGEQTGHYLWQSLARPRLTSGST